MKTPNKGLLKLLRNGSNKGLYRSSTENVIFEFLLWLKWPAKFIRCPWVRDLSKVPYLRFSNWWSDKVPYFRVPYLECSRIIELLHRSLNNRVRKIPFVQYQYLYCWPSGRSGGCWATRWRRPCSGSSASTWEFWRCHPANCAKAESAKIRIRFLHMTRFPRF